MFVVRYDLSDMPPNCRTFLRQRTLFMPSDANEHHPDSRKWLRYLIHLRYIEFEFSLIDCSKIDPFCLFFFPEGFKALNLVVYVYIRI